MGRGRNASNDIDDELVDIDDFIDSDESSDEFDFLASIEKSTKTKTKRNKSKKRSLLDMQESDDWQDPEDDIMYGFKE